MKNIKIISPDYNHRINSEKQRHFADTSLIANRGEIEMSGSDKASFRLANRMPRRKVLEIVKRLGIVHSRKQIIDPKYGKVIAFDQPIVRQDVSLSKDGLTVYIKGDIRRSYN